MDSIEAMRAEIEYQVQDLCGLDLSSSSSPSPSTDSDCCLFVGSGDSYVAGLAAQYFSSSHAICCYPIDIIKNPSLVDRRNLFIVSISGNTQANILAAKIAKKNGARKVTALTARPSSRLAKSCDQTIELRYRNTGITTAGTISFTASMIKCISLYTQLHMPSDIRKLYNRAEKQAEQVMSKVDLKNRNIAIGSNSSNSSSSSSGGSSSYFILGDGQLYAIARYATLKFNEVFGIRALAYPAEEFCHSPIFSITEADRAIVLGDGSGNTRKLSKRLNEGGFSSFHIEFKNTGIELLLHATFFIQFFVLKLAQKYNMTTCHFQMNRKLLKMSSDFIYP
ncbi:MAG: SIS domain-containing protein [Thermoproteota archaeon]|nr:SIS domain-containing protein [Thermoproteota archaeon]